MKGVEYFGIPYLHTKNHFWETFTLTKKAKVLKISTSKIKSGKL